MKTNITIWVSFGDSIIMEFIICIFGIAGLNSKAKIGFELLNIDGLGGADAGHP